MKRKLIVSLMVALTMATTVPQTTWAQSVAQQKQEIGQYEVTKKKARDMSFLLANTYGVDSVQYALMVDGEIVVSDGLVQETIHDRIVSSITPDTMYGIGSVSKVYTAVAMMKLVDMGLVDLDQPVTNYLPEFVMADERYKEITPRMLLNHSSGLMGSTFEDAFLFEDVDTYAHDNLLVALKDQKLKADPGAFSVYCNDGFTLAELVIERVSGMSFTDFIDQNIVEPLGLEKTKTPENIEGFEGLAESFSPSYKGTLPKEVANIIGAGGIYSTAEELCKFGQIFTGEKKVLSELSLKAMAENEAAKGIWPKAEASGLDYGLGWDSVNLYPFNEYGITALMKGGDTLSYHTSLIVLPEKNMTVAVATSGGTSVFNQMIGTELLLQALEEKGEIPAIKPQKTFTAPTAVPMPESQKQYAGIYVSSGQMCELVISDEGTLTLTMVGMEAQIPAQVFQYTGDGYFTSVDGSSRVRFEEKDGNTYLYVEGYATLPGIGQVASAYYNAQKIEDQVLSDEEQVAWEKRNGKLYYVINEKYTSEVYLNSMPIAGILMNDKIPGYMAGYEITGVDEAEPVGQIPGLASRDQMAMKFYTDNGIEYMELGSNLAIREDGIKGIAKGKSRCTIGEEGYGRWYTIDEALAGKTMSVTLPETGAVALYDANGICQNYTTVSQVDQMQLSAGSKVIFMGEPGTVFEINIQ